MNSSFLPGWPHIVPYSKRRLAKRCQSSPGILRSSEPFPWTTSSCENGQDVALGEGIHAAERDLVVMKTAVHGLASLILQHVVHPAHVPLEAEPEPAVGDGAGDVRPRRRLLGERRGIRELLADRRVALLEEVDRRQVLPPAVAIGHPLALVPRVVEVEHRGDGVYPQAVGVVPLQPADRARHQERTDLRSSVVEDRRRPVRVEALARISVLVEVGTVEAEQGMLVHREVRGHPIEQHTDAALVQPIDQSHQIDRGAVAGGRGEVARHLIAPRPVERMLHHREQLDVSETMAEDMVGERLGELVIGRPPASRRGDAAPRSEVHLVDRDRCFRFDRCPPPSHPPAVAPDVAEVGDA